MRLSAVAPKALVGSVRLRAVLMPRLVEGERTEIRTANTGAALRALGPMSAMVMRTAPPSTFARAARLARDLPSYSLDLSKDPFEAAGAIAAFLDTLGGEGM
jgi:hypothetical protein